MLGTTTIDRQPARRLRLVIAALAALSLIAAAVSGVQPAGAQGGGGGAAGLSALSTETVPTPPDIQRFVRDATAAQKLGKALFWDMQAGSDGRQACASCHFAAGADNRSRNQLNPRGGGFTLNGKGANAQLTESDFPFHKLSDPTNAASAVLSDSDNVSGSQGVVPSHFKGITEGNAPDDQAFDALDPDFHVGAANVRRTTGRNTPTVINAVFNFRNFWDGRAQNEFNGVDPFGSRDPDARVGQVNGSGGVDKVAVGVTDSSLASQATGPPGNSVEMSSDGRSLSDIGKKLLALKPLGTQEVSKADSLLGGDVDGSGVGLKRSYADLIRDAFQPEWWNSNAKVAGPNSNSYSLMQFNFPLFWGLAIQSYEATLVSDQTPVDRFLSGETGALSQSAISGMGVFTGSGSCSSCHSGAAMTDASVSSINAAGATAANGAVDTGFHNIGVRPTASDPGQAGTDPFGKPLSISLLSGQPGTAVGGTFKTPDLRNVALTAPYFHNGGQLTLRQVVDFYSRGGDFANAEKDAEIRNLGLSDTQKDDLVAFLESLTDPRVKSQSAPFDHPQLYVPVGEQTRADGSVLTDGNGRAVDCFKELPATGGSGGAPLTAFPAFTGPPCDTPPAFSRGAGPAGAAGQPTVVTSSHTTIKPGAKPNCSASKWITRVGRHARIGLLGMSSSRVLSCLGRPTGAVKAGSVQRWRYGRGLVLHLRGSIVTSLTVRSRKFNGTHGIGYGTRIARLRKALGGHAVYSARARLVHAIVSAGPGRRADVRVRTRRGRAVQIDARLITRH